MIKDLFWVEGMENDAAILSGVRCVKHYVSAIGMQYNKGFESSLIKLGETEMYENNDPQYEKIFW